MSSVKDGSSFFNLRMIDSLTGSKASAEVSVDSVVKDCERGFFCRLFNRQTSEQEQDT